MTLSLIALTLIAAARADDAPLALPADQPSADAPASSDDAETTDDGAQPDDAGDATHAPPPPGPRPLAQPGHARSGPPRAGGPRGRGGAQQGAGMDPARLKALREYKQHRLVIRGETERQPGNSYVIGYGGPYRRWGGVTTATVIHEPGTISHTWGVYQGPQRLSTPGLLGATGQLDRKAALDKDIRHARNAGRAWYVTAGVGGAGIVAGLVGMTLADNRDDWTLWNNVTFTGSMVTLGGLIGGTFPMSKARRLARYPSATLSYDEAQDLVDDYNDQLREDLGVSPADAWTIESSGQRRRD